MKLILFVLLFAPAIVQAGALASIYNGDQYNLNGQLLVQDADQPNDFYLIPQTYRIKQKSDYNPQTGLYDNAPDVNHKVQDLNGNLFSVYSMRLELEQPGQLELLRALAQLRRLKGPNVRIKGLAPICGLRVMVPGLETSGQAGGAEINNPKGKYIEYSISSTEGSKCRAILSTTEFNLQYRVPLSHEPMEARNLTSDVGIVLPPIEMILPYKYKDKVSLKIDARSAVEQLKAAGNIEGGYAYVSGQVKANISQLINRLQLSSQLEIDCQSLDTTACDRFVAQAEEYLSKVLVQYLPMASHGDTQPLVIADKDKAVNASMFRVALSFDVQQAERIGKFVVDFSKVNYDSVLTQVQIRASGVPASVLDSRVRSLLGQD